MIVDRLQRPSGPVVLLALRSAVAAVAAIWVGDRIGLHDTYWAGISAVVASAPTVGASVANAVQRVWATVVGLAVGLLAVAAGVDGLLVAGAAVLVTLIALPVLSLPDGARLGGATSLIVTAVPGHHAVSDALTRGANVPLGCVIAVAFGVVFWPRRAADEFRAGVAADTMTAARLAAAALRVYVGESSSDETANLVASACELQAHGAGRQRSLAEIAREPGLSIEERARLTRWAGELTRLAEAASALIRGCVELPRDGGGSVIAEELRDVAQSLDRLAEAVDELGLARVAEAGDALMRSHERVNTGFARSRGVKTLELPTDVVVRLLSVIHDLHDLTSTLLRLCASEPGPGRRSSTTPERATAAAGRART